MNDGIDGKNRDERQSRESIRGWEMLLSTRRPPPSLGAMSAAYRLR